MLQRVQLTSPGFWEFLGTLSPLEVMRNALNDRHRRRQDREYREEAERRRLDLQNDYLETEVLRDRIALAREAGLSDAQINRNGQSVHLCALFAILML